jgi:glycerol-3-phosphate cytidylyltransferase
LLGGFLFPGDNPADFNYGHKFVVCSGEYIAFRLYRAGTEINYGKNKNLFPKDKGPFMKRVITYGTFDMLHYGHVNLLKKAKALGDYLIVALSTDDFNLLEKQKKSYFNYEERKQLLEAIRYVDMVIPEKSWDQKINDIDEYRIDVFVIGDDWTGKFDFLKETCEVIYLQRTPEISTTLIKQELQKNGG